MKDVLYSPITTVTASRQRLIIPAFSIASTWSGVSEMLTRFGIGNVKPFTLKRPIAQPNESFLAAISWNDSPYVYRYKLTQDIGELLYFPRLDKQQIGIGAWLEIWSVNGSALAGIDTDWELQASKLVFPESCYCRENSESVLGIRQDPSTLPPDYYCNPFCFPLCAPSTDPDLPITTYPLYWGVSTEVILDESEIIGLAFRNDVISPLGEYAFSPSFPAAYLYWSWPDLFTSQPAAGTGFTSSGLPVAMAGAAEGYTETENGWNYALINVNGISYRLYRSYYPLNLGLTVVIISS